MASNFVQRGDSVTVVSAGTVASGDIVVFNALSGVALHDALVGEDIELAVVGVYSLPKNNGDVLGQGEAVYFDGTVVDTTATAQRIIGVVAETAGAGTDFVNVRLGNPGPNTGAV